MPEGLMIVLFLEIKMEIVWSDLLKEIIFILYSIPCVTIFQIFDIFLKKSSKISLCAFLTVLPYMGFHCKKL